MLAKSSQQRLPLDLVNGDHAAWADTSFCFIITLGVHNIAVHLVKIVAASVLFQSSSITFYLIQTNSSILTISYVVSVCSLDVTSEY